MDNNNTFELEFDRIVRLSKGSRQKLHELRLEELEPHYQQLILITNYSVPSRIFDPATKTWHKTKETNPVVVQLEANIRDINEKYDSILEKLRGFMEP